LGGKSQIQVKEIINRLQNTAGYRGNFRADAITIKA
jgi:hypothetical protein